MVPKSAVHSSSVFAFEHEVRLPDTGICVTWTTKMSHLAGVILRAIK